MTPYGPGWICGVRAPQVSGSGGGDHTDVCAGTSLRSFFPRDLLKHRRSSEAQENGGENGNGND